MIDLASRLSISCGNRRLMQIPTKPRRAYSAVRIIPLAVGLLVALALLPAIISGYRSAKDNTGRLLTANRDSVLDGLEQQLRDTLDAPAEQMAIVARMIAEGHLSPEDREGFSRFMAGAAQGQKSLVSIAWLQEAGDVRRWTRESSVGQTFDRASIRNVEGLWRQADARRAPFWNRPVISPLLGQAIIPHIQPVVRNGALHGVLITVLTAQSIGRHIDRMEADLVPYVLVGRDRVLVHRNIKVGQLPEQFLAEDRLPRLDEVGDPLLAIMWSDPRRFSLNDPARSQVHWSWIGESWQAQVYAYREVTGYGGEPWLIGFHQSSLATLRERWVVQGLLVGSGILFLFSVGAAFVLGRRAVRPAGEIAVSARALERLDFDAVARPALEASRIAEVRDIDHALQRAAAALKRFQTYVPRALVKQLMSAEGDASAAADREVTVLFMDLAGYTAFADGRSAREVAAYLNGIFAQVGPLIEATGGTIDKYTGDGLMAVWGAPVPDPDHARAALGACLSILKTMTPLVAAERLADPAKCRIRLGLHTGRVLAGDLGFDGRIDYTVVGRTVNIAQRCQTALRTRMGDAPVALAITESLRRALDLPMEGLVNLAADKGGEAIYRVVWLPAGAELGMKARSVA